MSAKTNCDDVLRVLTNAEPVANAILSDLKALTGPESLERALSAHNNALKAKELADSLEEVVNKLAQPIPVDDGTKVLKKLEHFVNIISLAVAEIVAKKSVVNLMGVDNIRPLFSQDVKVLSASILSIADKALQVAPPELKSSAEKLRNEVSGEFKKALTAYA